MQHHRRGDPVQRRQLAEDAARIMAEEGVDSHLDARTLATRRRFGNSHAPLPELTEIDEALRAYLRLFQADRHRLHMSRMRKAALHAIQRCEPFTAHLAGSVLEGNSVEGGAIELHLLGCTLEEAAIHLMGQRIAYRISERQMSMGRGRPVIQPMLMIEQDGVEVELVIFGPDDPRHGPRDPLGGGRMRRASGTELQRLIEDEEARQGATPPAGQQG